MSSSRLSQDSFVSVKLTSPQYPQEEYLNVRLKKGTMVEKKRAVSSSASLKQQLHFLKTTGRYECFKLKWLPAYEEPMLVWPMGVWLFWDSDLGKFIEGACYFLETDYDAEIDAAVQKLTDIIASAQHEDGYLNLHYSIVEKLDKRFTNFRDMCELYNAGHMLEGALAHHHYYKNDKLLGPMIKYMDLLCKVLGPDKDQLHGYPGHPELEIALLRLYERTKIQKYYDLAKYFVYERGNPTGQDGMHFYDWEAKKRGDDPNKRPYYYPERSPSNWYYSASCPLVEMKEVEGHSVRPMYLLTAVADIARIEPKTTQDLQEATVRLFSEMVARKMYVTGGIGSIAQYEGFGIPYFLPQGTDEGGCYAETCAGIGIMMMVQRVLQYDLNGFFTDIMELVFYNAVLTAMSVQGTSYTYVNQLASSDKNPAIRQKWFKCACCPPNILRTLAIIGGYIYSQPAVSDKSKHIAVHMFIPSTLGFEVEGSRSSLQQDSNYPWDGKIEFTLMSTSKKVSVSVRIPAWAENWSIHPTPPSLEIKKGYLKLPASYLVANPKFTLDIPLSVRVLAPHPLAHLDTITLARGPIVYCVEDVDNAWVTDHFKTLQLDANATITERLVTDVQTREEYVELKVHHGASVLDLDRLEKQREGPSVTWKNLRTVADTCKVLDELTFVPYYFRGNRGGKGMLRTGIKRWIR